MKTWNEIIQPIIDLEEFNSLKQFLGERSKVVKIYPENTSDVFNFGNLIQPDDIKLLIVNFKRDIENVNKSIRESLYSELSDEEWNNIKLNTPEEFASNGILYLESELTREEGDEISHYDKGWNLFFKHLTTKLRPSALLFLGHKDKDRVEEFGGTLILSTTKPYDPELIKELNKRRDTIKLIKGEK